MPEPLKLLLSNTYGHPNVGDEAILTAMVQDLTREFEDVEVSVLTFWPGRTGRNHPRCRPVDSRPLRGMGPTVCAFHRADVLIVGGGGIIQDQTSLGNLLFHLSRPFLAGILGVPVVYYALGVGPLRSRLGRTLTAAFLKRGKAISVRDRNSAQLLRDIGLDPDLVRLTADPSLGLEVPPSGREMPGSSSLRALKSSTEGLIGLSLRPISAGFQLMPGRPGQNEKTAWFMDAMVQSMRALVDVLNAGVAFYSLHPGQDDALGERLLRRVGREGRTVLIRGDRPPREMMALVGMADVMVGMRLHALIFASRAHVPLVGLAYDPKVEGFMASLDQGERVLPPSRWTVEDIMALTTGVWQKRTRIAAEIREKLTALEHRARSNVDILSGVLRELKGDQCAQ